MVRKSAGFRIDKIDNENIICDSCNGNKAMQKLTIPFYELCRSEVKYNAVYDKKFLRLCEECKKELIQILAIELKGVKASE